ncbi:MAG: DUF1015 domain-containing protein [Lachnospiraceae bacterium]|nr:DUF1015 domain-containing protein [Lachnospiraceae bacterium]
MAEIRPFRALRPEEHLIAEVAALPYDVYSREEAVKAVAGRPLSFLNIDRPETQFGPGHDMYADDVYRKADEMMRDFEARGIFVQEETPCYYIYALTMDGRTQHGLVACSAVDDYLGQVILRHENTRADKELDRIRHVDTVSAQTGPIFLAYRDREAMTALTKEITAETPLYDFTSEDGIRHAVWRVADPERVRAITEIFSEIPHTYIADGHHRAASAVRVALKRRAEHPDYTGAEEFNAFLSVLFPASELKILDYNRVVKDLNGLSEGAFLARLKACFTVSELEAGIRPVLTRKGEFGLFLGGETPHWYHLAAKPEVLNDDPVEGLDVSLLQNLVLGPVLGIRDPRTDRRIDFIGGIRGLAELERRVAGGMALAFAMYPTSMEELFAVADAGLLMPPKSTWFEPKLRSGLLMHKIER